MNQSKYIVMPETGADAWGGIARRVNACQGEGNYHRFLINYLFTRCTALALAAAPDRAPAALAIGRRKGAAARAPGSAGAARPGACTRAHTHAAPHLIRLGDLSRQ